MFLNKIINKPRGLVMLQTKKLQKRKNVVSSGWVSGEVVRVFTRNKKITHCLVRSDDGTGLVLIHAQVLSKQNIIPSIKEKLEFQTKQLQKVEIQGVDRFAVECRRQQWVSKECKGYEGMIRVFVLHYDSEQGFGRFEDLFGNTFDFRQNQIPKKLRNTFKSLGHDRVFYIRCDNSANSKLGPNIIHIKK